MRAGAVYAGFNPSLHHIIPAALLSHEVKRTITEKTVKAPLLYSLVTGIIPALTVLKKSLGVFHKFRS